MMKTVKKGTSRIETNANHFRFVDSFQNLEAIKQTGINLTILPRSVDFRLAEFIQKLDLSTFPNIETSFYFYECETILRMLLKSTTTNILGLELFIKDLAKITEDFCTIVNTELVRFRLQVVDNDMCKYFHCDYNNLRLISTYHGACTQWLSNDNVNRNRLGCQNNDKMVIDPLSIHQMEVFWVGIFKGELFLNNSRNGIVHRSPSLPDRTKKRLLLRMDI